MTMSDGRQAEIDRLVRENDRLVREVERWRTEARQAQRAQEVSEVTWRMREAARAAGVAETALEDVVSRGLSTGWGLDSKGRLRQVTSTGPEMQVDGSYTPPEAWIKSQRPHSPHWFADSGGGAQGPLGSNGATGSKNPWLKESWNMTEQGKIFRENPARAKQLAAAVGVKL